MLLLSDVFIITGFGLIDPILAIFIKDSLVGGEIYAAGIASTIFLLTKSLVQLPFSRYVDSHNRKALWLIIGSLCIATVPFVYTAYEWSLYSTITGIGTAVAAASGALMAEFLGFNLTFMTVGAISFIGCMFLFFIQEQERRKKVVRVHAPKHKK